MLKNWERALFLLLVSVILVILAWLVLDLGRSAMGQEAQPTHISVYLPLINALASNGVCSIVPGSRGRTFAKLHSHPGGDGALYVYIDGELITWFSAQGRWFYVTSKQGVAVYGYDSEGNLECGG